MFSLDFADVKPSLVNWMIVGLMAITFITLAKFAVNHFDTPVLKPFKSVSSSVSSDGLSTLLFGFFGMFRHTPCKKVLLIRFQF